MSSWKDLGNGVEVEIDDAGNPTGATRFGDAAQPPPTTDARGPATGPDEEEKNLELLTQPTPKGELYAVPDEASPAGAEYSAEAPQGTPGARPTITWKPRATPLPADIPHAGAVADTESSGGTDLAHAPDSDQTVSGGSYGIRPDTAKGIIRSDAALKKKYGFALGLSRDALATLLNHNSQMDDDLFRKEWGRVLNHPNVEGDPHRAYIAWNSGEGGLSRYDRYKADPALMDSESTPKFDAHKWFANVSSNLDRFDKSLSTREGASVSSVPGAGGSPALAERAALQPASGSPEDIHQALHQRAALRGGGVPDQAKALELLQRHDSDPEKQQWTHDQLVSIILGEKLPNTNPALPAGAKTVTTPEQDQRRQQLMMTVRDQPGTAAAASAQKELSTMGAGNVPDAKGNLDPSALHGVEPASGGVNGAATPAPAPSPAADLLRQIDEQRGAIQSGLDADQKWVGGERQKLEGLRQSVMGGAIKDPWASKSTGARVIAAIAMGLGEAGAALTHTTNGAMETIHHALDADLSAQKAEADKKLNLYKLALDQFGSDVKATEAVRLIQHDVLKDLVMELGDVSKGAPKPNAQTTDRIAAFGEAQNALDAHMALLSKSYSGPAGELATGLQKKTGAIGKVLTPNTANANSHADTLAFAVARALHPQRYGEGLVEMFKQIVPLAGDPPGIQQIKYKSLAGMLARTRKAMEEGQYQDGGPEAAAGELMETKDALGGEAD